MKIAKRVLLSIVCIAIPSAVDVLLRRYLEIGSIGMIPSILLYGPFLFLLHLVWTGRFDRKCPPAIPDKPRAPNPPPAPSRKLSAACLLFAASFICACLVGYWVGRESTSPDLQAQYEAGYWAGSSEATGNHASELLEAREESFRDGYRSAMRDASIALYNPTGMPLLAPSSFYDFDGRDVLRVALAKEYGLSPVRTSQEVQALLDSVSGGS